MMLVHFYWYINKLYPNKTELLHFQYTVHKALYETHFQIAISSLIYKSQKITALLRAPKKVNLRILNEWFSGRICSFAKGFQETPNPLCYERGVI